jgi:tRNA(Arg) A34 adenosine deaminase TadA
VKHCPKFQISLKFPSIGVSAIDSESQSTALRSTRIILDKNTINYNLFMNHENYIREAMKETLNATKTGNAPFGVVVVNSAGKIIWRDHDRVKEQMDPTAHGEINAIRGLCKTMNTLSLSGCIFYTTSEPCPTCLTGCMKAKVSKIVYGCDTELTASLPLKATDLVKKFKKYKFEILGGILADECLKQREKFINK